MSSKLSTPVLDTQGWADTIEDIAGPQRLVRHITSLQIKNFTPFPARDTLASTLAHPTERPQHTSDDIDLARGVGRTRRISSSSITSLSQVSETRSRRRTLSRASALESLPAGSALSTSPTAVSEAGGGENGVGFRSVGVARRPSLAGAFQQRPRANSNISVLSHLSTRTSNSAHLHGQGGGIWADHSQASLERILRARLVETFLAVSVPSGELPSESGIEDSATPTATPTSPAFKHNLPASVAASESGASRFSHVSEAQAPSPRSSRGLNQHKHEELGADISLDSSSSSRPSLMSYATAPSFPSSSPSSSSRFSHTASSPSTSTAAHSRLSHLKHPFGASRPQAQIVPDYISPVHHASTNPAFAVDFAHGLPPWTDRTSEHVTVQLWAKVMALPAAHKGKGKQPDGISEDFEGEWRLLEEWILCLADLVPLPDAYIHNPSRIPFNTLIVNLSTSPYPLYLPSPSPDPTRIRARSVSPQGRDGSNPRTASLDRDASASRNTREIIGVGESISRDASTVRSESAHARIPQTRTAGWPDLLKLATLQTALVETRAELRDASANFDNFIASDLTTPLKREISERQARVDEWRGISARLNGELEDLRQRIREKRMALHERREELEIASGLLADDGNRMEETEAEIAAQREQNAALRTRIAPRRAALIATLAWLFPIELRSPPDLLFTILDIPLAIPGGATDPAPPLSLPAHKDVNEDSVAAALGYAALVVRLLAGYTGIALVYPVTFIGSKSVIKDGISAMVGPRMFPLFSAGVDTYRFEYGVFLLNKDIELLMAERDLRALDVRHTLANLKNLLLTLSDGVAVPTTFTPAQSLASANSSLLFSRAESDASLASRSASPTPTERSLASGKDGEARTPTQGSDAAVAPAAKKDAESMQPQPSSSRMSFFGLGFLRARTAQTPSVRAVPEEPEPSSATTPVGQPTSNGHVEGGAGERLNGNAEAVEGRQKSPDGDEELEKTAESTVAVPVTAASA